MYWILGDVTKNLRLFFSIAAQVMYVGPSSGFRNKIITLPHFIKQHKADEISLIYF
jgi:hypothetical protein